MMSLIQARSISMEGLQGLSAALSIGEHEIHIWSVTLDCSATTRTQLATYLSVDEQKRADRYRFERHRHHFTVARGCLRLILGAYLYQSPEAIAFTYSNRGKPAIAPRPHDGMSACAALKLTFNLSHSGGVALYAISRDHPVGIDIEALRPMPDALKIARRFFSEREYQQLATLPISQQEIAFFRGWTRKEAYLKATGEGLAGLDSIGVSILPNESPALYPIKTAPSDRNLTLNLDMLGKWWIQDIPLSMPHVAAIVAKRRVLPTPLLSYSCLVFT